jgi:uncharacterized protein YyaL (SSP411 family)
MGRALIALYEVTGDRTWLRHSAAALHFIAGNFPMATGAGFVTSRNPTDHAYKPHPERDENAQLARFANLLYQYTGDTSDEAAGSRAMRYLATPEVAIAWLSAPLLLAEAQFTHPPTHITVVGSKQDPAATTLYRTALLASPIYKRVEWWDTREGPLPHNDVQYPSSLPRAAAFLCTATTCSSPIFDPQVLEVRAGKAQE